MAIKTVYKTSDGQEFVNKSEAEKHENVVAGNEQLKSDVIELLNKVAIKMNGKSFTGYSQTEVYLRAVQEIIGDLITGNPSSADQYVQNYYNSSQDC